MTKSNNSRIWFEPVRGSYLPHSLIGLAIYLVYVVYLAALLVGWYVDGHRIWYFLTEVLPLATAAAVLVQWIASRHSR